MSDQPGSAAPVPKSTSTADFGNWIRGRIIVMNLAAGAALVGIGWLFVRPLPRLLAWGAAAIPIGIGLFLTYLYVAFSERGGRVQRRLWEIVLRQLPWDGCGSALDIGTGQGALAIGVARRFPEARVTGVDLWAADWAYSQPACARNAAALGVDDRVNFQRASAASLPFADDSFDAVVSHFVFHEVRDGSGAMGAMHEAIRVLKPGGAFCFQDMFLDRRIYGEVDALLEMLRHWSVTEVQFSRLPELMPIPFGMRGRRVLGCAALVSGFK